MSYQLQYQRLSYVTFTPANLTLKKLKTVQWKTIFYSSIKIFSNHNLQKF